MRNNAWLVSLQIMLIGKMKSSIYIKIEIIARIMPKSIIYIF